MPKNQTFSKHGGNSQKINSAPILRLGGLSVKQITTYLVWLNIDIFTRKSIITEFRLNAAFGAQNLRRISKLRVAK